MFLKKESKASIDVLHQSVLIQSLGWNSVSHKAYLSKKSESESCSVLSDSLGPHGLPGSSVHGILQARILEWVAIPFSRESSQPRNRAWVSGIARKFFTIWATRKAQLYTQTLKLSIQKTKIMASGCITSWQIDGETVEQLQTLFWGALKSLQMVTAAMKLKDLLLGRKAMNQPRQHI